MKVRRQIIAACSFFIMGFCAYAHSVLDSTRITVPHSESLATLIKQGLQNNYQIRIVANQEIVADNNATRANAGYYPKINLNSGYDGTLQNTKSRSKNGTKTKERNQFNQSVNAGIFAEWTVFDGFKIQTNYKRLKEIQNMSATQTRMVIEDYVADLTAEYYNYIQQRIRLSNLRNAVKLSKERLRIVRERYLIGNGSRLSLQQAQVDFNADSAKSLKQEELLRSSAIRLNEMMAVEEVNQPVHVNDSTINVNNNLILEQLWTMTLQTNANLIKAAQNKTLAELDYNSVKSRDYPYVKMNANYTYRFTDYNKGNVDKRNNWGGTVGITLGYKLFDGNRQRERRNAQIDITNAELAQRNLELSLKADLADLWQAYQNNLRLLNLERQNLITAQENHVIAHERYLLGDLSGIEMREAQQNLLDADERILVAEYNTKLCEISLHLLSGTIMQYTE